MRWYKTLGLKNVRVGLFCEDYPALYDRQLSKVEVEFPEEMGKFNREHKEFRLSPAYGSGVICFRNLDDPSKYMSAEFAAVSVDELTKNLIDVFNILRGSLRWPGIDDVRFLAASNPGEKGHLWVKQLFIDRIFPPELEPYADQFAYVKALPTDNPYNADSYIEMLKGLPPKTRKAWLEGNWDVFEGQVFEEWDAEVHVLEEFKPPTSWRWAAGLDFGFRANGWLGLFASGSDGHVICMDEFVFKQLNAEEAGYQAGQRSAKYPDLEYIAADAAMWQKTGGGPTIAEQFQSGLVRARGEQAPMLVKITHGPGSVLAGLELTRRYLAWTQTPDGKVEPWMMPHLQFHKRCKYAIKTIPALPYKKETEQVDSDAEDHAYDGLGYFLMSRPAPGDPIPGLIIQDVHPGLQETGRRQTPWADRYSQTEPEVVGAERLTWEV